MLRLPMTCASSVWMWLALAWSGKPNKPAKHHTLKPDAAACARLQGSGAPTGCTVAFRVARQASRRNRELSLVRGRANRQTKRPDHLSFRGHARRRACRRRGRVAMARATRLGAVAGELV